MNTATSRPYSSSLHAHTAAQGAPQITNVKHHIDAKIMQPSEAQKLGSHLYVLSVSIYLVRHFYAVENTLEFEVTAPQSSEKVNRKKPRRKAREAQKSETEPKALLPIRVDGDRKEFPPTNMRISKFARTGSPYSIRGIDFRSPDT